MIETAYSKRLIICSNCESGPKEFIGKNRGGFLFNSNSLSSLRDSIKKFSYTKKQNLKKKKSYSRKKNQKYIIENHTKMISKYLN